MVSQEPQVWEISSSSEDDDDDDLICLSPKTISKRSYSEEIVVGNKKQRILEATDVDLDCYILEDDPCKIDSDELHKDDSMDLVVTGERVFVACRDYPHPRHLCAKYPFNSTPHEQHCPLCYCYVCDKLAPCVYWKNGGLGQGHCDASDKEKTWKSLRQMQTTLVTNNLRTDNQRQQVENRQTVRTNIRLATVCSDLRQLSGGSTSNSSSLISICPQGTSAPANLSHEASAFSSEGLTINVPALSMGTVPATTTSSSVQGYLRHRLKFKGMPTNGFSSYQVPAPNVRQPTIPMSLAHLSQSQPVPLRHRPRTSLIKPQAFKKQPISLRAVRPLPHQSFGHDPTRIPHSAPIASVSHSPAAVTPLVADTRVPYAAAASSFPSLCVSYGQAGVASLQPGALSYTDVNSTFLQNVDFQQQQQMQPFPISSTGQGGVELPPLPLNDLAVQFDWSFLDGISDLASS